MLFMRDAKKQAVSTSSRKSQLEQLHYAVEIWLLWPEKVVEGPAP